MLVLWLVLYLAVHGVHLWVDHHVLLSLLIAVVTL